VIVHTVPGQVRWAAVVRAAARQRLPAALKLAQAAPGDGILVACDPVRVVRGDSVEELAAAWAEERAAWRPELPGLPIGVGFLSYDLGRRFERLSGPTLPDSPWPLLEFRFYDAFVALGGTMAQPKIWARSPPAAQRLAARLLEGAAADQPAPAEPEPGPFVEPESSGQHLAAIARALEYIRAGDIYQVNLARRLVAALPERAGEAPGCPLLLCLERTAPAPHAFWLADAEAGTALVGNSPERFLRVTPDGVVETSPIKGTRPRGLGPAAEDAAEALLGSSKDRAEHVMIVDLERNDLGRICQTGSVEVAELCRVLALPTVYHLESTVRGRLRPEVGLATLLRATFPGGSVTGAPKIRAMEIIEELEPARRGPYTGATGWLGAAGDLDLAVAIRTALVRDGQLCLWVGGGIVADSTPESELAETWDKARAFCRG
jgi:para-aminobenzoate synthetase component 1